MKQILKHCPRCNQYFPATTEFFNKDKKRKYGITSYCKKCFNDYRKQYRQTHNMKAFDKKNYDKRKNALKNYNNKLALFERYGMNKEFTLIEQVRRDPNDQNLLQVKCESCSIWFNPINWKTRNRLQVIKGKLKGNSFLFCSDECKKEFKNNQK